MDSRTRKAQLDNSIKNYFAPILREDGFRGSGRNFRRVINDFINVVNIQGSSWGGQFAVNLGVQPLQIPDLSGKLPDPKRIIEPLCELRRRLSETDEDRWFKHTDAQESMDAAVREAADVYMRYGRVGSSRVDLQACKLEYSIVSPK